MSLAQLRREVNSLRLKLVLELRVVRARPVVQDYCHLWKQLVSKKKPPPNPTRLLRNLYRRTGYRGQFALVSNYLEECQALHHLPYPGKVLFNLLPDEASRGLISFHVPEPVKY